MGDRYAETQQISGEIWSIYKSRLKCMKNTDSWWDETVRAFNEYAADYMSSTHRAYVYRYTTACLEDLETVWKENGFESRTL